MLWLKRAMKALLVVIVALVAWVFIVYAWFPSDRDGVEVHQALMRIHACSFQYVVGPGRHGSNPPIRNEFPRNLTQLGPEGTKCLDKYVATGTTKGWTIEYTPTVDSTGRPMGWVLRTEPVGLFRKSKLRHYSAVYPGDANLGRKANFDAIVHVRSDGTPAQKTDPVYGSPLPNLAKFFACVTKREPDEGDVFPARLDERASCLPKDAFRIRPDTDSLGYSSAETWGPGFAYTITYMPQKEHDCNEQAMGESGVCVHAILDATIDARPTTYGETGVRSYVVFQRGMVNVDATNPEIIYIREDVPDCELWVGTRCGPLQRLPDGSIPFRYLTDPVDTTAKRDQSR
jgi:hypothetical protein